MERKLKFSNLKIYQDGKLANIAELNKDDSNNNYFIKKRQIFFFLLK